MSLCEGVFRLKEFMLINPFRQGGFFEELSEFFFFCFEKFVFFCLFFYIVGEFRCLRLISALLQLLNILLMHFSVLILLFHFLPQFDLFHKLVRNYAHFLLRMLQTLILRLLCPQPVQLLLPPPRVLITHFLRVSSPHCLCEFCYLGLKCAF